MQVREGILLPEEDYLDEDIDLYKYCCDKYYDYDMGYIINEVINKGSVAIINY